jgi:hypothetical protein
MSHAAPENASDLAQVYQAFEQLIGRSPTADEKKTFNRLRVALGVAPSDPLFVLLVALEHYRTLYEGIPRAIEDASRRATEQASRSAADALGAAAKAAESFYAAANRAQTKEYADAFASVMRAVKGETLREIAAAGSAAAAAVAGAGENVRGEVEGLVRQVARAEVRVVRWAAAAAVALVLVGVAGVAGGYVYGSRAAGLSPAALSAARQLASGGSDLAHLAACDLPGWRAKDGACFPHPDAEGRVHGWAVGDGTGAATEARR